MFQFLDDPETVGLTEDHGESDQASDKVGRVFHSYEVLAAAVCDERRQRGWSQTELAQRADVSEETVAELESGEVKVPLVPMRRVVDALGFRTLTLPGPLREELQPGLIPFEEAIRILG